MRKLVLPNAVLMEEAAALLDEGREVCFVPKGSSMLPFIRGDRDSVVLRKFPSVEKGDMVLARLQGRYVLHRVVRVQPEGLTLMGDGNIVGQEHCQPQDVLGTVVYIVRNGKAVKPGKGVLWRLLRPLRRYILAVYRRIV